MPVKIIIVVLGVTRSLNNRCLTRNPFYRLSEQISHFTCTDRVSLRVKD